MKQNEFYVNEDQLRLTEKQHQSYARSMHEPALDTKEDKALDTAVSKFVVRIQSAFRRQDDAEKKKQEEEKKNLEKNADKDTKPDSPINKTPVTNEHDTLQEPKVSLLSKLFGALVSGISNEKLLVKAESFTQSYKTLNTAKPEELKDLFLSWEPDTKDRTEIMLSKTAQRMILEIVKDKGISTAIFLQAVNSGSTVKAQEAASTIQHTAGVSEPMQKAIQDILDTMEVHPVDEWKTEDYAKQFVKLHKAVEKSSDSGTPQSAVDLQVAQVVENFLIDEVTADNVSENSFVQAVTTVVTNSEEADGNASFHAHPEPIQKNDEQKAVLEAERILKENQTATPTADAADAYLKNQPAASPETIHTFSNIPKKLSGGHSVETAYAVWKAFNRGQELSEEQRLLAERGLIPTLEGGSPLTRADDGEQVHNRLPMQEVRMGASPDTTTFEEFLDTLDPEAKKNLLESLAEADKEAVKKPEVRALERAENLKDRIDRWGTSYDPKKRQEDLKKLRGLVQPNGELTTRRGSILSAIKRAKFDPDEPPVDDPEDTTGRKKVARGISPEKIKKERDYVQKIFEAARASVNDALLRGDIDAVKITEKGLLDQLLIYEKKYPSERRGKGKEGYDTVENINDLCEQISRSDDRFDIGGDYQLIDDKTQSVNEQNFMIWIREQMVYWHGQDPDSEVKFFSQIAVDNNDLFRPINLGSMIANKSLYFKTRDNNTLEDLYNEVTNLAWLIGGIRNMDISYRLQMTPEEKNGELMASLLANNMLTKKSANGKNTLEAILTMAGRFYDKANHGDAGDDFMEKHRDMDLGDGIATGLAIYYNITDKEKLQSLIGADTHFFKRSGFKMALEKMAGVDKLDLPEVAERKMHAYLKRAKLLTKDDDDVDDTFEAFMDKWFGKEEDGELQEKGRTDFMKMLNVFVPEPHPQQVDLANQLIRQAITELSNKHKEPRVRGKPNDFAQADVADDATANFAQLTASLMSWWGGAAAKADTGVAAVNGMSKYKWVRSYKYKQADSGRAGPVGNLYGMGTVQEVYVDVFTGMLTIGKKSIMEVVERKIKDLKDKKSFEEKEKTAQELNFNLNTAKQYGANTSNAAKIYLSEGGADMPHFHDFIEVNQWGTVRINADKMAEAFQDKIIKPARYNWRTNPMPFHKDVRKLLDDPKLPKKIKLKDGREIPVRDTYMTVTQLENTFSRQAISNIQKIFQHDMHHKFNMDKDDKKSVDYFTANAHAKFFDEKAGRVYRFKVNEKGDYVDKKGKAIHMPHHEGGHHQSEVDWLLKRGVVDWDTNKTTVGLESKLPKEIADLMDNSIFRSIVVRSYLVTRFGGLLYGNSVRNSPYKFLDILSREHAVEGLESIPTNAVADEDDLHANNMHGHYFSHFDIQLIRKLSNNQRWKNYSKAVGESFSSGTFEGLKELWSFFWKNAFS